MYVDYCLLRPAEACQWRPHKHSRLYYIPGDLFAGAVCSAEHLPPGSLCVRRAYVQCACKGLGVAPVFFDRTRPSATRPDWKPDWTTDTIDRSGGGGDLLPGHYIVRLVFSVERNSIECPSVVKAL